MSTRPHLQKRLTPFTTLAADVFIFHHAHISGIEELMDSRRAQIERFGASRWLRSRLFWYARECLGLHLWSIQTRRLSSEFDMPAEHAARFTFKRLSRDEALRATNNPALDLTEEFVSSGFDRGDVVVGAFDGGNLVAYTWRTLRGAPVGEDLWLQLNKPSLRYGYKAFVLPEYRGERLTDSVARFFDHYFVNKGVTHDIGYIALYNLSSARHAWRDPTRRRIGYAGYLKIGRFVMPFSTPGVKPLIHLSVLSKKATGSDSRLNLGSAG